MVCWAFFGLFYWCQDRRWSVFCRHVMLLPRTFFSLFSILSWLLDERHLYTWCHWAKVMSDVVARLIFTLSRILCQHWNSALWSSTSVSQYPEWCPMAPCHFIWISCRLWYGRLHEARRQSAWSCGMASWDSSLCLEFYIGFGTIGIAVFYHRVFGVMSCGIPSPFTLFPFHIWSLNYRHCDTLHQSSSIVSYGVPRHFFTVFKSYVSFGMIGIAILAAC